MPGGIVTVPACFHVTPSDVVDTDTRAGLSTITQSDDESMIVALFVAQPIIPRLSQIIPHRFRSVRMGSCFWFLSLGLSPAEQRVKESFYD